MTRQTVSAESLGPGRRNSPTYRTSQSLV